MEQGHKEAISSEFRSVRQRLFLLSEIVDGSRYDIPDPGDPGTDPNDIARALCQLVLTGKEKILELARSRSEFELP
jgi:hypothetical protein